MAKQPDHWQPDDEAVECRECGTEFSFIWRKHHCRVCGLIYCNQCAPRRNERILGKYSGQRVCSECYYRATHDSRHRIGDRFPPQATDSEGNNILPQNGEVFNRPSRIEGKYRPTLEVVYSSSDSESDSYGESEDFEGMLRGRRMQEDSQSELQSLPSNLNDSMRQSLLHRQGMTPAPQKQIKPSIVQPLTTLATNISPQDHTMLVNVADVTLELMRRVRLQAETLFSLKREKQFLASAYRTLRQRIQAQHGMYLHFGPFSRLSLPVFFDYLDSLAAATQADAVGLTSPQATPKAPHLALPPISATPKPANAASAGTVGTLTSFENVARNLQETFNEMPESADTVSGVTVEGEARDEQTTGGGTKETCALAADGVLYSSSPSAARFGQPQDSTTTAGAEASRAPKPPCPHDIVRALKDLAAASFKQPFYASAPSASTSAIASLFSPGSPTSDNGNAGGSAAKQDLADLLASSMSSSMLLPATMEPHHSCAAEIEVVFLDGPTGLEFCSALTFLQPHAPGPRSRVSHSSIANASAAASVAASSAAASASSNNHNHNHYHNHYPGASQAPSPLPRTRLASLAVATPGPSGLRGDVTPFYLPTRAQSPPPAPGTAFSNINANSIASSGLGPITPGTVGPRGVPPRAPTAPHLRLATPLVSSGPSTTSASAPVSREPSFSFESRARSGSNRYGAFSTVSQGPGSVINGGLYSHDEQAGVPRPEMLQHAFIQELQKESTAAFSPAADSPRLPSISANPIPSENAFPPAASRSGTTTAATTGANTGTSAAGTLGAHTPFLSPLRPTVRTFSDIQGLAAVNEASSSLNKYTIINTINNVVQSTAPPPPSMQYSSHGVLSSAPSPTVTALIAHKQTVYTDEDLNEDNPNHLSTLPTNYNSRYWETVEQQRNAISAQVEDITQNLQAPFRTLPPGGTAPDTAPAATSALTPSVYLHSQYALPHQSPSAAAHDRDNAAAPPQTPTGAAGALPSEVPVPLLVDPLAPTSDFALLAPYALAISAVVPLPSGTLSPAQEWNLITSQQAEKHARRAWKRWRKKNGATAAGGASDLNAGSALSPGFTPFSNTPPPTSPCNCYLLRPGLLLTHINGQSLAGVPASKCIEIFTKTIRPVHLRFLSHPIAALRRENGVLRAKNTLLRASNDMSTAVLRSALEQSLRKLTLSEKRLHTVVNAIVQERQEKSQLQETLEKHEKESTALQARTKALEAQVEDLRTRITPAHRLQTLQRRPFQDPGAPTFFRSPNALDKDLVPLPSNERESRKNTIRRRFQKTAKAIALIQSLADGAAAPGSRTRDNSTVTPAVAAEYSTGGPSAEVSENDEEPSTFAHEDEIDSAVAAYLASPGQSDDQRKALKNGRSRSQSPTRDLVAGTGAKSEVATGANKVLSDAATYPSKLQVYGELSNVFDHTIKAIDHFAILESTPPADPLFPGAKSLTEQREERDHAKELSEDAKAHLIGLLNSLTTKSEELSKVVQTLFFPSTLVQAVDFRNHHNHYSAPAYSSSNVYSPYFSAAAPAPSTNSHTRNPLASATGAYGPLSPLPPAASNGNSLMPASSSGMNYPNTPGHGHNRDLGATMTTLRELLTDQHRHALDCFNAERELRVVVALLQRDSANRKAQRAIAAMDLLRSQKVEQEKEIQRLKRQLRATEAEVQAYKSIPGGVGVNALAITSAVDKGEHGSVADSDPVLAAGTTSSAQISPVQTPSSTTSASSNSIPPRNTPPLPARNPSRSYFSEPARSPTSSPRVSSFGLEENTLPPPLPPYAATPALAAAPALSAPPPTTLRPTWAAVSNLGVTSNSGAGALDGTDSPAFQDLKEKYVRLSRQFAFLNASYAHLAEEYKIVSARVDDLSEENTDLRAQLEYQRHQLTSLAQRHINNVPVGSGLLDKKGQVGNVSTAQSSNAAGGRGRMDPKSPSLRALGGRDASTPAAAGEKGVGATFYTTSDYNISIQQSKQMMQFQMGDRREPPSTPIGGSSSESFFSSPGMVKSGKLLSFFNKGKKGDGTVPSTPIAVAGQTPVPPMTAPPATSKTLPPRHTGPTPTTALNNSSLNNSALSTSSQSVSTSLNTSSLSDTDLIAAPHTPSDIHPSQAMVPATPVAPAKPPTASGTGSHSDPPQTQATRSPLHISTPGNPFARHGVAGPAPSPGNPFDPSAHAPATPKVGTPFAQHPAAVDERDYAPNEATAKTTNPFSKGFVEPTGVKEVPQTPAAPPRAPVHSAFSDVSGIDSLAGRNPLMGLSIPIDPDGVWGFHLINSPGYSRYDAANAQLLFEPGQLTRDRLFLGTGSSALAEDSVGVSWAARGRVLCGFAYKKSKILAPKDVTSGINWNSRFSGPDWRYLAIGNGDFEYFRNEFSTKARGGFALTSILSARLCSASEPGVRPYSIELVTGENRYAHGNADASVPKKAYLFSFSSERERNIWGGILKALMKWVQTAVDQDVRYLLTSSYDVHGKDQDELR